MGAWLKRLFRAPIRAGARREKFGVFCHRAIVGTIIAYVINVPYAERVVPSPPYPRVLAAVACQAHNLKVGGSIPSSGTMVRHQPVEGFPSEGVQRNWEVIAAIQISTCPVFGD